MTEALGIWSGKADRYQQRFRAGEISYEEFCRLDAEEWRGMPIRRLREICNGIPYHEGAADLLRALKEAGLVVGIVSTGLSLLAHRVRREHALDDAIANELVVKDGVVTGEVRITIAHGEKDRALAEFCGRFDLARDRVAAVGDTEGDLSMFRAAGWSIAFNAADRRVEREASAAVEGVDLRGLIPLLLPSNRPSFA